MNNKEMRTRITVIWRHVEVAFIADLTVSSNNYTLQQILSLKKKTSEVVLHIFILILTLSTQVLIKTMQVNK